MDADERAVCSDTVSRRRLLRGLGAGGAAALTGLAGCNGSGGDGTPTSASDNLTFVLSTARSGPYADVGGEEERGFELAVTHLNQGGGLVDGGGLDLDGSGVMDMTVDTAVLDTESTPDIARANLEPYIGDDPAALITGGIGGTVVREQRNVAHDNDVVYFPGLTTLDGLTGSNCSKALYRETFNTSSLIEGLGAVVGDQVGETVSYFQVSVDAPEGIELQDAVDSHFPNRTDASWEGRGRVTVRPGTTNFESAVNSVSGALPDAVFVNLFGLDAANAIQQLRSALDEVTIIAPVLEETVASTVGANVAGAIGATPWHPSVSAETGGTFAEAYRAEYGENETPTGVAWTSYVQTLLFADAAESANGYEPDAIRGELEGRQYDFGVGSETMRACDHQAKRPVPVVRGRESDEETGRWLELMETATDVTPSCNQEPASNCSF